MSSHDDIANEILAHLTDRGYIGIQPSELTPWVYGDICYVIMTIDGVASVGIHASQANGTMHAAVELDDGNVLTVVIADPASDGDYLDGRVDEIVSAKFAELEARLNAKIASLEVRIACLTPHPWLPNSVNATLKVGIDGWPMTSFGKGPDGA